MPFDILEKPICYSTFLTEEDCGAPLKRCTKCRCAWYSSVEEQRANWPLHKKLCKKPDYDMVKKMSLQQCLNSLDKMSSPLTITHNYAIILERVFDLVRNSDVRGLEDEWDHEDVGLRLHSYSRLLVRVDDPGDYLKSFYQLAWACPGMPQLLFFSDFRSIALTKMMSDFPNGRPMFDNEEEKASFNEEYNVKEDSSGESIAWFIVGFLVRSCIWGKLTMSSKNDGFGNFRDTKFGHAAIIRLGQIFSSTVLRKCGMSALYPVPSLVLNITREKPDVFLQLLNMGIGLGILGWADQEFGRDTLKIMCNMDLRALSYDKKLDLLEVLFCIFEKEPKVPWESQSADDFNPWEEASNYQFDGKELIKLSMKLVVNVLNCSKDLKTLLSKGVNRRPEFDEFSWFDENGDRKRIILAFLLEKMTLVGKHSMKKLATTLTSWSQIEFWEKMKYAKSALSEESYGRYCEQAKYFLNLPD